MIKFKIVPHKVLPINLVEIWVDGVFRGALYPQEPDAVLLISSHFAAPPIVEVGEPKAWRFVFDR